MSQLPFCSAESQQLFARIAAPAGAGPRLNWRAISQRLRRLDRRADLTYIIAGEEPSGVFCAATNAQIVDQSSISLDSTLDLGRDRHLELRVPPVPIAPAETREEVLRFLAGLNDAAGLRHAVAWRISGGGPAELHRSGYSFTEACDLLWQRALYASLFGDLYSDERHVERCCQRGLSWFTSEGQVRPLL